MPARQPSKVDLPEPLRPITAVMVPARTSRSTPSSANVLPYEAQSPSAIATTSVPPTSVAGTGSWSRAARIAPARRLASRTVTGSGDQPASRPRSMIGGASDDEAITTPGSPTSMVPAPSSSTTRSAKGSTRSRRCSASTTVRPTSWTSRVRLASTSSAAHGSRAEVGSSRTRIPGDAARTAAIATRWRCPPDKVASCRSRSSWRLIRSSASSTRRRITDGSMPRFSMA